MKKPVSFLLQVQNSPWEVQVRILPLVQRANQRRTRRTLHVTGVIKRDIKYKEELEEKKKMEVRIQVHAASIREYADRLTGLGDSPSETLMVAVLLI